MDPTQLADTLSAPLTKGQTVKTAALNHAVDQQTALVDALALEQQRAAALHGKDSKKAQQLQAFVATRQQGLTQTQTAATTAKTRTPIANPQEFIIYGYVYGQSGGPAGDVIVGAADANGTILQNATSDSDGSYAVHIPAAQSQTGYRPPHHESMFHEVIEKIEECVEGEDGEHKPGQTAPPPPVTLHLVASDSKKTFQVQSPDTFQFEAGKLAYEDLTVPV
jgi:hypothetical protein